MAGMRKIILASNSPRRKALFGLFGWPFEVLPSEIDESQLPDEAPAQFVQRLACEKAQKVAEQSTALVIGADTIVVDGSEVLGKPADEAEAVKMLRQLRDRTHQVYTGIAIIDTRTCQSFNAVSQTDVTMRDYSNDEIQAYVATKDPLDKAGAYAIQHEGFHPVAALDGCFASVMGLPLCLLSQGLREFDMRPPDDLGERCQEALNFTCPILAEMGKV